MQKTRSMLYIVITLQCKYIYIYKKKALIANAIAKIRGEFLQNFVSRKFFRMFAIRLADLH